MTRLVVLACLLFALPISAIAQQDTSPPVIESFSYSPTSVDTTSSTVPLTVTMRITDDLSGVNAAFVRFRSPSGTDTFSFTLNSGSRISGDALDGVYEATIPFPQFVEPGTWTVSELWARDSLFNYRYYDAAVDFPPATLAVTSNQDSTDPVIESFSYSPTSVDTTSSTVPLTVTMRITDDLSGVNAAFVRFRSPSGTDTFSFTLNSGSRISGDALDGVYEATIPFPQFVEPGTWTVSELWARDSLFNYRYYDAAVDFPPATLAVTSNQDSTDPVIESFSYSPTSVDTTSSTVPLTVTMRITDDLSGVNAAFVRFRSPSGTDTFSFTLNSGSRISGDALDGVYEATIPFPQFVEPGTWTVSELWARDSLFNYRYYDAAVDFPPATLAVNIVDPGQTDPGTNVSVEPEAVDENGDPVPGAPAITFDFDEVTGGGETTVTITETGPPPSEGLKLGNPPTYFDLDTTATFTGSVEICIDYSGISYGGPPSNLTLSHFVGGVWVDVTTSNDTIGMIICGSVTSLSFFAIFEPIQPVPAMSPAGFLVLAAGLLGAFGYHRRRR